MIETTLDELEASQRRLVAALRESADRPGRRPGEWSAIEVAGHLAASEHECFEPRIKAIATGSHPHFDFYSNGDRDFSAIPLESSLSEWKAARLRIIAFARGLAAHQLAHTGRHDDYGEVTIDRYLQIALGHDAEHLQDLSREP